MWQKFGHGWDADRINDIEAITIRAIYDDWVKNYLVSQSMVDGSPKIYRYQAPRQIILSFDFSL